MAAASTLTSTTGTAAGTDPNFTLTQDVRNCKDGVFLYLNFTVTSGGTASAVTIVCKTICPTISATDTYDMIQTSGSSVSSLTYTIGAVGRYKIPIAIGIPDGKIVLSITPNTTTGDAVLVANLMES